MKSQMIPFGDIMELAPRELVGERNLPVMSITMRDGLIDQEEKFKKRIASSDISTYKLVRLGNLVVGFPIDEGVLGFQQRYEAAAVSPAYDIWQLTGKHAVDRSYFERVLRSDWAREIYAAKMRGTTSRRRTIPKDIFRQIEFPLPPLTEQKRIAGILDAADALRAKRRAALAELDTLLQSTFLDLFGDPVTNPMGWRVVQFGEVSHSRLGKMLDAKQQTGKHVRPYLANANVQWGHFVFDDLREMDFNENDRQEFRLQYGDLLICEGGEVGRTAIWREQMDEVYFQKALHRCRLDSRLAKPEYMQYYMWFMSKHGGFKDFTTVATIAHLTGVKLKKLPVPLPPLALQGRFAAIFESVEQQKERMNTHQTELDALFASLQSRAFNGEL